MAGANKTLSRKLERETWTSRVTRIAFPILVRQAMERRKITYGEWAKEISKTLGARVHHRNLNKVAGLIGDICKDYAEKTGTRTPEINLIVVNKQTGIPGEGADLYMKRFCEKRLGWRIDRKPFDSKEKQAIIKKAAKEIFDFPGWDDVLDAYGLVAARNGSKAKKKRKRVRPKRKDWHKGPESDAHKRLKRRIASNPGLVGVNRRETGKKERLLYSGDKVDVYFKGVAVAVEVKAGNAAPGELQRGVFQCIKYRAVLEAQQISNGEVPTANCRLAIGGRLPDELRNLCERLEVEYFDELDDK